VPRTPQVTLDFYGSPVRFREIAGELWLTPEEAVVPLGVSSVRTVRALFDEHREDFLENVEFRAVEPGDVVFSLAGLDHLALLHSNDANVRARRWTAAIRELRKRAAQISTASRAQADLCASRGLPLFAPQDGVCWSCRRQIYEELDGKSFVTGCPFCHRSYCD
jgi:hypothetical protein